MRSSARRGTRKPNKIMNVESEGEPRSEGESEARDGQVVHDADDGESPFKGEDGEQDGEQEQSVSKDELLDGHALRQETEEDVHELPRPPNHVKPPEAIVEEHNKTHIPYRSWCDVCNQGRGLGERRGHGGGSCHCIPIVGMDYFYITTGNVAKREDLKHEYEMNAEGEAKLNEARKQGKLVKCILIRCYQTKCMFAHVIPSRETGEDGYTVGLVVSAVSWIGHVKVILKSDGEPAILKLVKKSLEEIKTKVEDMETATREQSHPRDSQSNGGTEVGIRIVRGLFRTLRLCLEKRVGHRIPPNHPLTPWLLEHTAVLLNASVKGDDGRTAWCRARGRNFGANLYGFGESVFWKHPNKGPQHDVEGNMGPRLFVGTFLGYNKFSNSHRTLTEDGKITKARALQSRPFQDRWNVDKLKEVDVTPWDSHRREQPARVDLGEEVEKYEEPKNAPVSNPRRLNITKETLKEYGTTEGCPQCRHYRSFDETKPGLGHSENYMYI